MSSAIIPTLCALNFFFRSCRYYQGSKHHPHFSQRLDNVLFHFQSPFVKNEPKMRLLGVQQRCNVKGKRCIFIKLQLLKLSKKS